MTRTRMLPVLAAAGIVAIVAGIVASLVIVSREHDDASRSLRTAAETATSKRAGAHAIQTSIAMGTPIISVKTTSAGADAIRTVFGIDLVGTPIPVESLQPVTLMFCEPLREPGGTSVATIDPNSDAEVAYAPDGCESDVDATGDVLVREGDGSTARMPVAYVSASDLGTRFSRESVVWTPAKGNLNGAPTIMTGRYLKQDAEVVFDVLGSPFLNFNMTEDGQEIFGSMSERLIGLPLATFLGGEPLRGEDGQILAPTINGRITDSVQITGLSPDDANRIAALINNGLAQ